jgi:hypothetical protein
MQHQLNADITAELSHSAAKPDHIHPRLAPVRRFIGDELLGIAGRAIDGKVDDFCGQIISPQCALLYRTVLAIRRLLVRALEPIVERLSPQTHRSAGRSQEHIHLPRVSRPFRIGREAGGFL